MKRILCLAMMAAVLAGCAVPFTGYIVPDPSLKSDKTLGYQTEDNRHDIRLLDGDPKLVPGKSWRAAAFPFGDRIHEEWDTAGYPFIKDFWCPFGAPTYKGEKGCFQRYQGIKVEGGKLKEFRGNGWKFTPGEFHPSACKGDGKDDCWPSEQEGDRWKSDLDPFCTPENMAGCINTGATALRGKP